MASEAAAGIDPAWPITTEDDPHRVYCSNPICGGVDVHPHYHQRPATAAVLAVADAVTEPAVHAPDNRCEGSDERLVLKEGPTDGT